MQHGTEPYVFSCNNTFIYQVFKWNIFPETNHTLSNSFKLLKYLWSFQRFNAIQLQNTFQMKWFWFIIIFLFSAFSSTVYLAVFIVYIHISRGENGTKCKYLVQYKVVLYQQLRTNPSYVFYLKLDCVWLRAIKEIVKSLSLTRGMLPSCYISASEPQFLSSMVNSSVTVGRDAALTCHISHTDGYKVPWYWL